MWKNALAHETVQKIWRILFTAVVLSVASTLIESVAGVGGRVRLVDLTGALLERPFWMIVFGAWAAFVCVKLRAIQWPHAIEQVLAWSPLALLVPCVNIAIAWLGLEASVPAFVNVLEAPVSFLTFGWLPRLVASPGVLVFLVAVLVALIVQGWRAQQPAKRILLAVLFWFLGTMGILLIPSFVSWVIVSTEASPLNAGPNILARAWVAFSQEGYWWRSILERFPGVLEGEAEASVRLLQLVLGWLVGLGVIFGLVCRQWSFSLRQLVTWMKPVRGISFLATVFFGVWIGRIYGGVFLVRAIDVVAWLLLLVALVAVWGVSVWRNDVYDLQTDSAAERDRPVSSGSLRLTDWSWLGWACLMVALISGWLLGWPVFVSLTGFLLLQEALHHPALRWKERWFAGGLLALSSVCVAAAGIFFAVRTSAVPLLPASIWLMLGLFYLLQALPKAFRWSPSLLGWLATRLHLSPRFLIPIVLGLSYLVVPLLSGWVTLWWIAIPCTIVALLPLLGNGRWDERKIVGWQTAFILIAFLLLAVHPSP